MFKLQRIGSALIRTFASSAGNGIQLTAAARTVLKEAEARGYRVSRSTRQGSEAVVIERDKEGASRSSLVERRHHWLWQKQELGVKRAK